MNDYIKYMFDQYVLKSSSKEFNTLVKPELLQMKQVDFTKMYKHITGSTVLFNELNLLMAKGVIKYSPANCTVELSLPNVMVYQRLQKLIRFAYRSLHPHVAEFINQWIGQGLQNGMGYPVMFEKSLISKVFVNSQPVQINTINLQQQRKKSKSTHSNKQKSLQTGHQQQKSIAQSYNYHRLVYEYKSSDNNKTIQLKENNNNGSKLDEQGEEIHTNNHKNQQVNAKLTQQQSKKSKSVTKNKDNKKSHKQQSKQTKQKQKQSLPTTKNNKQQPQSQQYDQYMVNLQQLTRLLQSQKALDLINSRLTQKQKKQSLFEFLQLKDRQTIIQQLRWQRQQQFLAQILGQNCLLVFNLIKKYPYITEKQLIKLTLMEVLETRQALNQLLQRGWVYFYYENSRTIVYKICDSSVMYKQLVDSVARAIVNLSLAAQKISETSTYTNNGIEQVKDKLIKLECEIQRLDDVLLLFGY